MQTIYQGACHCGRTKFTVSADIDHVRICNCSICHHRGALIFRVAEDQVTLATPLSDLTTYVWGTGTARDYFCKTCGILPFRRPRRRSAQELAMGKPDFTGWAINARCLNGFDPTSVPARAIDGLSLSLPEDEPDQPPQ